MDAQWASAPQHEARVGPYCLEPFSYRSISNYPITGLRFWEKNVSYDRHAEPIGEMVHVSALERLGTPVAVGAKTEIYAPKNLLEVLDFVAHTYAETKPPNLREIRIVDWSGDDLDSGADRAAGAKIVAQARLRLRAAGVGGAAPSHTAAPPLGPASQNTIRRPHSPDSRSSVPSGPASARRVESLAETSGDSNCRPWLAERQQAAASCAAPRP